MSDAEYFAVAELGELAPLTMKRIQINGKRLLLAHGQDGYFAVDEMCSHEDYSLFLGCIKGNKIKCSLHGSYFDLASGKPLDDPADEPINTYPTKIEGDHIWVALNV